MFGVFAGTENLAGGRSMRTVIISILALPFLFTAAFARDDLSPTRESDPLTVAKRESADVEKARLIEQLRHSNLRMQAQQKELEAFAQRSDGPSQTRSPTAKSVEQQHPEWFEETNAYKPCPWNMCPSPPPQ
jgi:hypothetical protein